MSAEDRPEDEYRSAQREGSPVSIGAAQSVMGADRGLAPACFAAAAALAVVACRVVSGPSSLPGFAALAGIGAVFIAVGGWNLWTGRHSEQGDDLLCPVLRNARWLS